MVEEFHSANRVRLQPRTPLASERVWPAAVTDVARACSQAATVPRQTSAVDFRPVLTPMPRSFDQRALAPAQASRRRAALSLAASGVQLVADYRQAPSMGARAASRAFHRLSMAVCQSSRVRVHVDSELPHGPCILVANHQSYLDPALIGSLVPCLPIAKVEIMEWPMIGDLVCRYGALFVRQGDTHSSYRVLQNAAACLKEGGTILNFPEGVTSEGRVGRFRRGIFGLAALTNLPVVPVAVAVDSKLMRKGEQGAAAHYLALLKDAPHDVFLRFGKALPGGCEASALARLARARIAQMVDELREANGLFRAERESGGSTITGSHG